MPTKLVNLKKLNWEGFYNTPLDKKLSYFSDENHLFDCLFSQQFNRKLLDHLFSLATKIRTIAKSKEGLDWLQTLLSHKRSMLYFIQPSTRTFLSFQSACQILGMKVSEIRSTSTSSEAKGESLEDTVRTFSSYTDLLIMRHFEEGFAEKTAWLLNKTKRPVPVINGGSGKDQHPTQALLDLYTLNWAFNDKGGIDNKTIAMVGDLNRGRTVRSLTYLLKNYKNIKFVYISPDYLRIGEDIKQFLKRHKMKYSESDDMKNSIKHVDAIYMTRIQDEYDINHESKDIDYSKFHLKKEHLKHIKKHTIIMHPLPRRDEIEPTIDDDARAMYWRQERNGMWMRAAVIAHIFKLDGAILYY
jgi:aspartate carbamoyltransferase catalytic subunit